MTIDPSLIYIAATACVLTVVGILSSAWRQPSLIAYLVAGVLLGPSVIGLFPEAAVLDPIAGIGLVLLLFFIGLEVDLRTLGAQWKIAVFGSLLQTAASVGIVWLVGRWFDWPLPRIILMGFVITLSCTPIALRILSDRGLLNTRLGASTLGILVVQDLLAIPMLIILGTFEGEKPDPARLLLQISSAIAIIGIIAKLTQKPGFHLPLSRYLNASRELQVLAALTICFGTAVLTGLAQLSVVLGGFVAGLVLSQSSSLTWVRGALEPFSFVFVAMFFVSVGVLMDVAFLLENWLPVVALAIVALLMNTAVNAVILLMLRERPRDALLAAAGLAQLGEFGFVLGALGLSAGVITAVGYQYVLAVTALSWVLSPLWISIMERIAPAESTTA